MIFHQPDRTMSRLKSCWKRADYFAKKGAIDNRHPLAAAWSNCALFMSSWEPSRASTRLQREEEDGKEIAFDAVCLDWFAERLDRYAAGNLLSGDATVAAILFEWRLAMPFHPDPPPRKKPK